MFFEKARVLTPEEEGGLVRVQYHANKFTRLIEN